MLATVSFSPFFEPGEPVVPHPVFQYCQSGKLPAKVKSMIILGIILLLTTLHTGCASSWPSESRKSCHVIVISVDGMMPGYYLEARKNGIRIPAIKSLMERGCFADAVEGVCPTVTYPSHTTMVTGVRPRRHGIVSNNVFDPYNKTYNAWYWYAEDIKVKTLWAAAREKQLVTGNSYWPVTVGAEIDYNFPEFWRAKVEDDIKLLRAISTRGLVQSVEDVYGKFEPAAPTDENKTQVARFLIERYRPHLLLVHLTNLDHVEHVTGPFSPDSFHALEEIDTLIDKIVLSTRTVGIYDQTTFFVVSDHGFARTERQVRPGILMKNAGLIETDSKGKVTDWKASFMVAGGIFMIRLKTPDDGQTRAQVQRLFEKMPGLSGSGIGSVFQQKQILDLGADPEAVCFSFGNALEGEYLVKSPSLGTHGYLPSRPDQKASFIAAGQFIRKGVNLKEIKMVDIAPTIAQILKLDLPDSEGKVLTEILVH